jgi:uncharacterized membrane protein
MKNKLLNAITAQNIFILIALVFGLVFTKITPPLWGADEGQHFFRAYQVSNRELSQKNVDIDGKQSTGGVVPASFVQLDKLRQQDISDAVSGETKQVDQRSLYVEAASNPVNTDKKAANPYGKNIYSIFVYLVPAAGVTIGRIFSQNALTLLFFARISVLLVYIAMVTCSIYILRKTYIKWIVFIIALLPMSIFQATTVSPDSLLLGLSLIFFSVMYTVMFMNKRPKTKDLIVLTISAALMTLVKVPYLFLVFLLAVLPLPKTISPRKKLYIKLAIPLISIIIGLISFVSVKSVLVSASVPPNVNSSAQIHWIISNPLLFMYVLVNSVAVLNWVPQTVGLFGSSFVFIPGIIFQLLLVLLLASGFIETRTKVDKKELQNRFSSVAFIAAATIVFGAVVTVLFLTWTPVGAILVEGIQGRYFLPIIIFALVGLRLLTNARLNFTEKSVKISYSLIMASSLLVSILWYYRILY